MTDEEHRDRQRQALELLTVRVLQDTDAWETVASDLVGDEGPDAVRRLLDTLVGMTEVALRLLREAALYSPIDLVRDPVDYLRALALYLEEEWGEEPKL
jgi:hypothetical protein